MPFFYNRAGRHDDCVNEPLSRILTGEVSPSLNF